MLRTILLSVHGLEWNNSVTPFFIIVISVIVLLPSLLAILSMVKSVNAVVMTFLLIVVTADLVIGGGLFCGIVDYISCGEYIRGTDKEYINTPRFLVYNFSPVFLSLAIIILGLYGLFHFIKAVRLRNRT